MDTNSDTVNLQLENEALKMEPALLTSLIGRMRERDPEMLAHGDRTAQFAVALGRALDLDGTALIELHYAGLLHDIGKLTLPDKLLRKNGPLTADEYAVVQSHPRAGARLLESFTFLRGPAVLIAHHHEHWNGSGYPFGLRGDLIPIGSRILAVADAFDALTSGHSTGLAYDNNAALRLLHALAGSQLEPKLVTLWDALARRLPPPHRIPSVDTRPEGGLCLPPLIEWGPSDLIGGPPLPLYGLLPEVRKPGTIFSQARPSDQA